MSHKLLKRLLYRLCWVTRKVFFGKSNLRYLGVLWTWKNLRLKLLVHNRLHFALFHCYKSELGPSVEVAQKSGKVSFIVQIFGREPAVAFFLIIRDEFDWSGEFWIGRGLFLGLWLVGCLVGRTGNWFCDNVTIGALGVRVTANWNGVLVKALIVESVPNAVVRAENFVKISRMKIFAKISLLRCEVGFGLSFEYKFEAINYSKNLELRFENGPSKNTA